MLRVHRTGGDINHWEIKTAEHSVQRVAFFKVMISDDKWVDSLLLLCYDIFTFHTQERTKRCGSLDSPYSRLMFSFFQFPRILPTLQPRFLGVLDLVKKFTYIPEAKMPSVEV